MLSKLNLTIAAAFIAGTGAIGQAAHAADPGPRNEVCALASIMVNEGGQAGLDKLTEMFSWNEKVMKQIQSSFRILAGLSYTESEEYIVADFGDISREYFVAIASEKNGAVYFRLRFEKVGDQLRLLNIAFKDKYDEIMVDEGAFAQPPVSLDC